jgi:hypothetical protein
MVPRFMTILHEWYQDEIYFMNGTKMNGTKIHDYTSFDDLD